MNRKILSIVPIILIVLGAGCAQKISPEEFKRLKEKGIEHAKKEEFIQAVEMLEKASNAKPEDTQIYPYLAESYEHLQQYDKAIETWQKLIYISPRNSPEAEEGLAKLKELESRHKTK